MERMSRKVVSWDLEELNAGKLSVFSGMNTKDSVLGLETEIRKVHANKESVIAEFFHIEEA